MVPVGWSAVALDRRFPGTGLSELKRCPPGADRIAEMGRDVTREPAYLEVEVGNERYAVPIAEVLRVAPLVPVRGVAREPGAVGIVEVDGEPVPLFDAGCLLEDAPTPRTWGTRIVLWRAAPPWIVRGVRSVFRGRSHRGFVRGVDRWLRLLDPRDFDRGA